jgi:hypothetical protein
MQSVFLRTTLAAALIALCTSGLAAQAGKAEKFSGIKLVDPQARQPEATVSLVMAADAMMIHDENGKELKTIPYSGITAVMHTLSQAPPISAGAAAAAPTQPNAPPMYLGKDPRHYLTVKTEGGDTILRVSAKVYDRLKASLANHNVKMEEGS